MRDFYIISMFYIFLIKNEILAPKLMVENWYWFRSLKNKQIKITNHFTSNKHARNEMNLFSSNSKLWFASLTIFVYTNKQHMDYKSKTYKPNIPKNFSPFNSKSKSTQTEMRYNQIRESNNKRKKYTNN